MNRLPSDTPIGFRQTSGQDRNRTSCRDEREGTNAFAVVVMCRARAVSDNYADAGARLFARGRL